MSERSFTHADIDLVVLQANGLIGEFQEQRNAALNQLAELGVLLKRERAEAAKLRDHVAVLSRMSEPPLAAVI